jgi:glycosyltransferase involved in cell wall biosynthesis
MAASAPVPNRPVVSVIIPARNEEASLGACLESLVGQTGILFEIIVVDDDSTDHTREIAASFPSVKVIPAPAIPPGWSGKNNAVTAGTRHAKGRWLLFTDADTVHCPGSLGRSVTEAERQRAALLSYSPQQEVHGLLERAVMPAIFAELAATYRPSQVSDPRSSAAAANGQYVLVSREAYDAVGGHAAVASSLLEDVELARRVKKSGRKIFFRYGGDAVRTRMYRSFAQLQEGWAKNLALLFSSPVRLAVLRSLEFVLIVGSAALALSAATARRWPAAGMLAALAVMLYAFLLRRIRKAHFSADANALSLFGLPLFAYLLLRSVRSYRRGRVSWKGREYGTDEKTTGAPHESRQIARAISN